MPLYLYSSVQVQHRPLYCRQFQEGGAQAPACRCCSGTYDKEIQTSISSYSLDMSRCSSCPCTCTVVYRCSTGLFIIDKSRSSTSSWSTIDISRCRKGSCSLDMGIGYVQMKLSPLLVWASPGAAKALVVQTRPGAAQARCSSGQVQLRPGAALPFSPLWVVAHPLLHFVVVSRYIYYLNTCFS